MSVLYDEQEERKYLFVKKLQCTNCGNDIQDVRVMNSKLRRKEPDNDLRPRFQHIDSLKYGVTMCPQCGYAALSKNFESLNRIHQKRLREKITSNFMPRTPLDVQSNPVISYETAVGQYELAILCAMTMELAISEQSYLCLQTAWLLRGWLEEAQADPKSFAPETLQQIRAKEERYYRQAYDGLLQAAAKEDFPICGLDSSTYDYLMAVMSVRFKEYDTALKCCGNVVQAMGISAKLKDKALTLKDEINAAKKADEEAAE